MSSPCSSAPLNCHLIREDFHNQKDTIYAKVSTIRRFLIFLSQQGHECYIPRMPKKHDTGFIPYIYSKDEMTAIFKVVDDLRLKGHHAESIIILPALIRLPAYLIKGTMKILEYTTATYRMFHSLVNLASKGRNVYCSLPLMATWILFCADARWVTSNRSSNCIPVNSKSLNVSFAMYNPTERH